MISSQTLVIYNLSVKQFAFQVMPQILWGLIWICIACKGQQWSSQNLPLIDKELNGMFRDYSK